MIKNHDLSVLLQLPGVERAILAEVIDCDDLKGAIDDGTVFIPKSQSRHGSTRVSRVVRFLEPECCAGKRI